uniref:ATP-dependent RNA helicase TDRD12 n=1 Tax=Haemonchus contortus TaxID=6289 RepID=A0A7I4YXX4_HAECO
MKRTPKSKIASLHQFWAAQQQQQQPQRSPIHHEGRVLHDVITLSDSPMEHLNITPLSNKGTPELANKVAPSWAPLARHSTTSDPTPAPMFTPPPLRHVSPASKEELEKAGFDSLEGSSIRYPANEYLRQFEIDIVKSCVSQNSAVCLPLAVSADHICAIVTANFLRWFPRSRSIYCCNSLDAAHLFQERCVFIGIPTDEVFIADTFQTFKKTPVHKVGRVIVTTPQTIEKIVESDSLVVSDIRCVVLFLDASENLRITKYKNVVGSLTLKNILFRVILVTPSVPSTSRKLGPLRKRQQTITSLLISQWIEPPACDLVFRNNAVPLGLSVEYTENVEVLSETRSFIEKWLERTVIFLESLNDLFPLPSTKPQDLFLIDWTQISARASSCADDTVQLVVNCMFLVESARNLIVHGPRVFYLYCVDLLGNAEKDSRASNLALMVLSDPVLSKVYEKIQAKYSYNTDSIFDISFCKVSQNSHPKFVRLNTIIDKIPSPLSCLVLCENDYVTRVVCESLENPRSRNGVIRVFSQPGVPPALAEHYRLPSRCSGLCNRPHFIIVVSANTPNFTDVIDTICSNQLNMVVSMDRRSICLLEGHSGRHVAILDATCEKLRPTDGRLINAADEVACRRSSLFGNGKVGVIERYTFKYELSRLQLPSNKMEMVQYIPSVEKVRQKTNGENSTRRHGFELTSSEFSEYCDRLATLPQVEHGIYSKRCFSVLGEIPNPSDRPFVYVPGDIPKGVLSQRLEEYMRGGDVIRKRLKRQFTYKDDLIDKESLEFYDDMITRLNRLLCI